jgi:hypothetical protein
MYGTKGFYKSIKTSHMLFFHPIHFMPPLEKKERSHSSCLEDVCFHFLNKTGHNFWRTFRFIAKLMRKYNYLSYISCPHTCIAFPTINVPYQRGIFVTTDEPILIHHYPSQPITYIRINY